MKILYFAWLRGKTGTASEQVTPPAEVATVGELMRWLARRHAGLAEALAVPGAVHANWKHRQPNSKLQMKNSNNLPVSSRTIYAHRCSTSAVFRRSFVWPLKTRGSRLDRVT
jgi:molybdopterin converting factor small subunit